MNSFLTPPTGRPATVKARAARPTSPVMRSRRNLPIPVLVPLLLAVLATLLVAPPADAAAPHAARERQFLELMNTTRRSRGLSTLAAAPEVAAVARAWSRRMAADGRLRHNPHVARQIPIDWRRWGENVGWASRGGDTPRATTRRLHRSFMDSPGHRANVLGRFNQVGVGVAVDDDGRLWATMVFVQGPRPRTGLTDIGGSTHRAAITTAWRQGLIDGCGPRRFCPGRRATRREVATTVARMVGLEPSAPGRFTDVTRTSEINALAEVGVVQGCTPRRFCPDAPVTRAQTASLLVRALPGIDARPAGRFTDLPDGYVHAGAVGGLAAAGVVNGCARDRFCPARRVTRAQLAAFVVRARGVRR